MTEAANQTPAQRIGGVLFALAVGGLAAWLAWQWISDPAPRAQRLEEEAAVMAARDAVTRTAGMGQALTLVDPLAPDRKIGKVYIYPLPDGYEISGYYQRDGDPRWHPWLARLDGELVLTGLRLADTHPGIAERAAADPRIEVLRPADPTP